MRKQGCKQIILYLWRPGQVHALEQIAYDASCYHVDDEYSFSEDDVPNSPEEEHLLRTVDQVFVHTPGLLEKKGGYNPRTTLIPLGVDWERFSQSCAEPEDLKAIPGPRIGYVGALKKQLNWDLLLALAHAHPEWSFVFVGNQIHDEIDQFLKDLRDLGNVHLLGGRPTAVIHQYVRHMSVGIMPYRLTDYARYLFPLKLHEYLAAGLPAVGAPIRTLLEYADVIDLADGVEEWSRALARALRPSMHTAEAREARSDVARQHDWQILVRKIAWHMAQLLDLDFKE